MIALLIATPAGGRAPPPPPDLGAVTLDRADPAVDAMVAGMPVRLAVTLDSGLYLAAVTAARLPLDWRKGEPEQVGRVRIDHRQAAGAVTIAGATVPMRIQTQDEPCCDGHDGAISVADLPWSTVRIGEDGGLAERRFPLELDNQSGLSVAWRVNGHVIHVVLAPSAPETVATASAAAILAQAYGGHLEDAVRAVPVAYGVARTVRDMRLDRPFDLLGFRLARVAVRIGDFAGDSSLPAPAMPDARGDEIEVRHKPLPPQFRWAAITIGRDLLGRCPAITFRRAGDDGNPAIGLACAG
ncbi:MAG TPA: hypothetical protein VGC10_07810 [Sphingomonas sp.]